jgi:uncharacterized phiE125 gp8 family phage protein
VSAQWIRTVDPAKEPLTLAEAKAQARITYTQDEDLLASYIKTAREAAEDCLHRGLYTQTWKLTLDQFADVIWLPMAAPLQSVTSVQYYATDGTLTTLSTTVYEVDLTSRPCRIARKPAQAWPSVQADRNAGAVFITYVVGWTDTALIPERFKQGMRHYLTYLDLDRPGTESTAAVALAAAEACWADVVHWIQPRCVESY